VLQTGHARPEARSSIETAAWLYSTKFSASTVAAAVAPPTSMGLATCDRTAAARAASRRLAIAAATLMMVKVHPVWLQLDVTHTSHQLRQSNQTRHVAISRREPDSRNIATPYKNVAKLVGPSENASSITTTKLSRWTVARRRGRAKYPNLDERSADGSVSPGLVSGSGAQE
jgi:hypothetical protein